MVKWSMNLIIVIIKHLIDLNNSLPPKHETNFHHYSTLLVEHQSFETKSGTSTNIQETYLGKNMNDLLFTTTGSSLSETMP